MYEQKFFGTEPDITTEVTTTGLIHAYNWYNYICSNDDAKQFVLTYLESKKEKKMMGFVEHIDPLELRNIGWNLRIKYRGGVLPKDIEERTFEKLNRLIEEEKKRVKPVTNPNKVVVSVQDRINAKLSDIIGDFETELDGFAKTGEITFIPSDYIKANDIKPMIAKKIAAYYEPLAEEIRLTIAGKDVDLKHAYKNWKKPKLKKFLELINSIIDAGNSTVGKKRRPKVKKRKKRT